MEQVRWAEARQAAVQERLAPDYSYVVELRTRDAHPTELSRRHPHPRRLVPARRVPGFESMIASPRCSRGLVGFAADDRSYVVLG